MIHVLATIAFRLGCCLFASWTVWRFLGPAPMVLTLPAYGLLLARPLIELASAVRLLMKRAHLAPVEGRHYAFRGRSVQVIEDVERRRWVRIADVRAIVGFTASDGALAISYPDGVRRLGPAVEPHIAEQALLVHLRKERSAEAARLRLWVQREIVFPAQRERERLGIRVPAFDEPGDDAGK